MTDSPGLPTASGTGPYRAGPIAILIVIVLIGGILRFHDLTRHSLWNDEVFTLEASSGHGLEHLDLTDSGWHEPCPDLLSLKNPGPWWRVATSLSRDDNHPPLYFLIVRFWRDLFGDGDFALRALSALISLAVIPLMYDAVATFRGEPAPALWAAALVAVANSQIQYAQEARAYALMLAVAAAGCALAARIVRDGASLRRVLLLGSCVLALMLTHYYAATVCAALAVYLLIKLPPHDRRMPIAVFAAAATIYLLVWGPWLWQQRPNFVRNNQWVHDDRPDHAVRVWRNAALVPIETLFEPRGPVEGVACVAAVLYLLPLLLLRRRPEFLLWWLILFLCVAPLVAHDLIAGDKQLEFIRYFLAASIGVIGLISSIPVPPSMRALRHAIPAIAVAGAALALQTAYAIPPTPKPDWREYAGYFSRDGTHSDVLILLERPTQKFGLTGAEYVNFVHYLTTVPKAVVFSAPAIDAATMARLRSANSVWLLIPREIDLPSDPLPGFKITLNRQVWGLPLLQHWQPDTATSPASRPHG